MRNLNYKGVTSIVIPETVSYNGISYQVVSIGESAFAFCKDLKSVTIPKTITSIGYLAFAESNCERISISDLSAWCKITCSEERNYYGWDGSHSICHHSMIYYPTVFVDEGEDGYTDYVWSDFLQNYYYDWLIEYSCHYSPTKIHELYLNGKIITDLVIPNNITEIRTYDFFGNTALQSVKLHNGVKNIRTHAFDGCTGLRAVYALMSDPTNTRLEDAVFENVPLSSCTLHVPRGSKALYQNAEQWKDFGTIIDDAGSVVVKGDLTGDGRVDIDDVNAVVNLILGRTTLYCDRADTNADGKVNVADLNSVINAMLGR